MKISDFSRMIDRVEDMHGDIEIYCGTLRIAGIAVINTEPKHASILTRPEPTILSPVPR